MIRKVLFATLASLALTASAARAEDTIVWWDFLSGGDGVRMKAMLEEFNKEHAGKVKIDATTSEWGTPFYTKVQTAAATGQGPDVMTYHELRMPLGVSEGVLSPLTPEELAAAGIKASDFSPANWKAAQGPDGKQYAVPLDIHSIILYYNKDLLKKAGLLGDDGKPKGLDGAANFDAALAKLTSNGVYGLSVPNDGAPGWRIFYTLLNQEDGQFLKDGKFLDGDNLDKADHRARRDAKVDEERLRRPRIPNIRPRSPSSPQARRRCTSTASGKCRPWSISPRRGNCSTGARSRSRLLYSHPATWADSHSFAIPNRKGNPVDRRQTQSWCSTPSIGSTTHSLEWAGGGHVPAYLPVQESAEFKAMKPNSDYVSLAKTAVFDPVSMLRRRRLARLRRRRQLRDAGDERRDGACRRRETDAG